MSTSEATPLSAAATQATDLLTKENAGKAAAYLKERAETMSKAVRSGDTSIRALALVGGIAMVVTGVLSLLGRIISVHWVSAILTVYVIIFGLLVILLEGKRWLPIIPGNINASIRKYALFLEFVWGRGILYFFIGSLQLSLVNIVDMAVGAYMCFVGVVYIAIGRVTAKKLAALRKSMFTEEQLRQKFYAVADAGGSIDFVGFKNLMETFGIELDKREAESAFIQLDKSGGGKVTFDEFLVWWNTAHFDSEQNTQFALSV